MPKKTKALATLDPSRPDGWTDYHQLDWFKALDAKEKKKCDTLASLAEETAIALNGAVSVYVSLVKYVRTSQLTPDLVKATLSARGYNDARISEIHRVAAGPDDILEALEARTIGFKAALAKIRDKDSNPNVKRQKAMDRTLVKLSKLATVLGKDHYEEIENGWKITLERIEVDEETPHVKSEAA